MNILFPCLDQLVGMFSQQVQGYKNSKNNQICSIQTNCSESSPRSDDTHGMAYLYENRSHFQVNLPIQEGKVGSKNLQIHNCQFSRFVILPSLENAIIDGCENCYIFIGPCHSTVFVRNCRNVKIRALCQQLRLEDSHQIWVEALVGVQPVLQNSSQIKFCALSCTIPLQLLESAQKAGIHWLENQIYEVYDFTPKKTANFENRSKFQEIDNEWRQIFKDFDINQTRLTIKLPPKISVKNSMLMKTYNSSYFKNNTDILLIYSKLTHNQLLTKFSTQHLTQGIEVLSKANSELGIQTLRTTESLQQLKGYSSFWIVKVEDFKIQKALKQLGVQICKDDSIILSLLKNSL